MYNPKSLIADEFISNQEILETLDYAEKNKNNLVIYQAYLKKNYNLIDYCYETSLENINICSNYNKYTIVPTIINHDYYYSTYQELKNGQIFLYNILNDIITSRIEKAKLFYRDQ